MQRLIATRATLFVCDIQTRFRPLIHNAETVIHNSTLLYNATRQLEIPCVVTEHYAKAMGQTVSDLALETDKSFPVSNNNVTDLPHTAIFQKVLFSMMTDEVDNFVQQHHQRDQVILCGIETHVCILQTALSLLERNYNVWVVCDAVSSQRQYDRNIALKQLEKAGAILTTSESVIFDLLKTAKHPAFKNVSTLLKTHNAKLPELPVFDAH